MITVSKHINPICMRWVNLGICTPAFSHAWINAAPCSILTFLPSTVISISALWTTDRENARCWGMWIDVFVERWRGAAVRALRRSISPPPLRWNWTLTVDWQRSSEFLWDNFADIMGNFSQSEACNSSGKIFDLIRAGKDCLRSSPRRVRLSRRTDYSFVYILSSIKLRVGITSQKQLRTTLD